MSLVSLATYAIQYLCKTSVDGFVSSADSSAYEQLKGFLAYKLGYNPEKEARENPRLLEAKIIENIAKDKEFQQELKNRIAELQKKAGGDRIVADNANFVIAENQAIQSSDPTVSAGHTIVGSNLANRQLEREVGSSVTDFGIKVASRYRVKKQLSEQVWEELDRTLDRAAAEAGVDRDELIDLLDPAKPFPLDK